MRFTKRFNIKDKFKIKDIVYHKASKTLTIEFMSGKTHVYRQVEEITYKEIMKSKNKNRYLRENIYQIYPREVI